MGVTGLWKLIENAGKEVTLESLDGKVLAVDASILLNQAMKGMKDQPNAHLYVLFLRLCKLLTYRIKPIFVFDGGVPALKRKTIAARQRKREEASVQANSVGERLRKAVAHQKAIDNLIGKSKLENPFGEQTGTLQKGADLFELPPLPESSLPTEDDEYYELPIHDVIYSDDFDIRQVDINSDGFQSLPAEYQHEILEEIRENTKHQVSIEPCPQTDCADDFSSFQVAKVLKSNVISRQIETLRKQMISTISEDAAAPGSQILQANRVMSEDSTHYLLVKNDPSATAPTTMMTVPCSNRNLRQVDAKTIQHALRQSTGNSKDNKPVVIHDGSDNEDFQLQQAIEQSLKREDNSRSLELVQIASTSPGFTSSVKPGLVAKHLLNVSKLSAPDKKQSIMVVSESESSSDDEEPRNPLSSAGNTVIVPISPADLQPTKKTAKSNKKILDLNQSDINLVTGVSTGKNRSIMVISESESSSDDEEPQSPLSSAGDTAIVPISSAVLQPTKKTAKSNKKILDLNQSDINLVTGARTGKKRSIMVVSESESSSDDEKPQGPLSSASDTVIVPISPADLQPTKEMAKSNRNLLDLNQSDINLVTGARTSAADSDEVPLSELNIPDLPQKNDEIAADQSEHDNSVKSSLVNMVLKVPISGPLRDDLFPASMFTTTGEVEPQDEKVPIAHELSQEESRVVHDATVSKEAAMAISNAMSMERHNLHIEMQKHENVSQTVTKQMTDDAQELLQLFGVPYIVSPSEAEAQCAKLDELDLCDGVITDDSDVWLFGCSRVLKNFFQQDKFVLSFHRDDIKRNFGLDREKFIALALVCGSDYTDGIPGAGPVTALEIIAEFDSTSGINALKKFKDWMVAVKRGNPSGNNALREKFKKLSIPHDSFPSEIVADAYLKPKVDDSSEKFEWSRPDLDLLRQFAAAKLNWSTKKVDDLVIPMLARFNSRDTQKRLDQFFKFQATSINTSTDFHSKRLKSAISKMITGADTPSTDETPPEPKRPKTKTSGHTKVTKGGPKTKPKAEGKKGRTKGKSPAASTSKAQTFKVVSTNELNLSESSSSDFD